MNDYSLALDNWFCHYDIKQSVRAAQESKINNCAVLNKQCSGEQKIEKS